MKTIVAIACLALLSLAGCSDDDDSPSADELASLREVAARSPLIVRGTPDGEIEQFFDDGPPYTLSTIVVNDVVKGEPAAKLQLRQLGTARDEDSVPEGVPLVDSGTTYWLFLQPAAQGSAFELLDRALYRLAGDDAVLVTDAPSLPRRMRAEEMAGLTQATQSAA